MRRLADFSYRHRKHKPGEYCYMRDKEEKEEAKWKSDIEEDPDHSYFKRYGARNDGNTDSTIADNSDNNDDSCESSEH